MATRKPKAKAGAADAAEVAAAVISGVPGARSKTPPAAPSQGGGDPGESTGEATHATGQSGEEADLAGPHTEGETAPPLADDTLTAAARVSDEASAAAGSAAGNLPSPQSGGADPAPGAIADGGPDPIERRMVTACDMIEHDGEPFGFGSVVVVTEAEFRALRKAGVIEEIDWDECEPFE